MSAGLAEFLLARITEAEARVDTIPDWRCTKSARGEGWGSRGDCDLCGKYMFDGTEEATEEAFWRHYEDVHQRSYVLADCEAKRRIVETLIGRERSGDNEESLWHQIGYQRAAFDVLRLLALPYADRPDYRPEWRP